MVSEQERKRAIREFITSLQEELAHCRVPARRLLIKQSIEGYRYQLKPAKRCKKS